MTFSLIDMRTIYIDLTWKQAKWLLKLIDALHVALGAAAPIEMTAIRNKLWEKMKE